MSNMKELYEKVAADSTLQAKFAAIMKDAEKAGNATREKLTAFAKEAGYDVTIEEVQAFFKELTESKERELSDSELDHVAGGKSIGGGFNVAMSFISLGIGCAFSSLMYNQQSGNCTELYE